MDLSTNCRRSTTQNVDEEDVDVSPGLRGWQMEEKLQLVPSKGIQPKIVYNNFVYRLRRSGMTSAGETYYFHCDKGRRRDPSNTKKKITVCRVYLHAFKDMAGNFYLKNKPKSYGHTCVLNSLIVRNRRRSSSFHPVVGESATPADQTRGLASSDGQQTTRLPAAFMPPVVMSQGMAGRPILVQDLPSLLGVTPAQLTQMANEAILRILSQSSGSTEDESPEVRSPGSEMRQSENWPPDPFPSRACKHASL